MTQMNQSMLLSAIFVLAALMLIPRDAHAYIDPAVGSLIFQAVVAGVLAIGYTARRYWALIRAFVLRWLRRS